MFQPWLNTIFFVILILHYVAVKMLNVYYVYDIPAMIFYMAAFLLLTAESRRTVWLGVLLTVIFALNRETIVFALLHAAAFMMVRDGLSPLKPKRAIVSLMPIVMGFLAIIVLRIELAHHLLHVGASALISTDENGVPRFVAYTRRLLTSSPVRIQLLTLGCGMLIWLSLTYTRFTYLEKCMVLFSIPGFIMLNIAGNFVELRIYTESVPLLSLLFMA